MSCGPDRRASAGRLLPAVLKHVHFEANPAGKPVVAAYDWLRDSLQGPKPAKGAPQEVITTAWQRHVFRKDRTLDRQAQLALCRPARKLVRRIGMGSHAAHRMPYSRALGPAAARA